MELISKYLIIQLFYENKSVFECETQSLLTKEISIQIN